MIYIPLWSYSNTNFLFKCEYSDKFTFHYGPIQIGDVLSDKEILENNLHSTMVLFKFFTSDN